MPQSEIDFRVVVSGRQQPLRPAVSEEVHRIGREALVNAFRQSGAKRVELELEYADSGRGESLYAGEAARVPAPL